MIVIDRIREFILGRCPKCRSFKVKNVKGWNKQVCEDCKYSWKVGL